MKLLVVALIGCASSPPNHTEEPVAPPPPMKRAPIVTPIEDAPASAPAPAPVAAAKKPYADEIHSVAFKHATVVLKHPGIDSGKLGVIRKGARAAVTRAIAGDHGCERWLEIVPRGWVCESAVEPSRAAPTALAKVSLGDDDGDDTRALVPGV